MSTGWIIALSVIGGICLALICALMSCALVISGRISRTDDREEVADATQQHKEITEDNKND